MTTVTPIGARRRITALAWLGWSPPAFADVTGLAEQVFLASPRDIERGYERDVLERVGAAYDLLWDTTPPTLTEPQSTRSCNCGARTQGRLGTTAGLRRRPDRHARWRAGARMEAIGLAEPAKGRRCHRGR